MNAVKFIFDALYPKITRNGVEKMFLYCLNDISIDVMVKALSDETPIVEIDPDVVLAIVKEKNNDANLTITGYRNNNNNKELTVDYLRNKISAPFNEDRVRYYANSNGEGDWEYSEDDKHPYPIVRKDYNWREVKVTEYIDYVNRPVEE